jgi:cation transport protein ChaC
MASKKQNKSIWIFGYGSLLWRPGFTFQEKRVGYIEGFSRKFYQGSPDHRGVPQAPGRVVTLVPEEGAKCYGVAYQIPASEQESALVALDYREKGGYEQTASDFFPSDGSEKISDVVVYRASEGNPFYLGPTSDAEMVKQILCSYGPSGRNDDYLFSLARTLRSLGIQDDHVFQLEKLVHQAQRAAFDEDD